MTTTAVDMAELEVAIARFREIFLESTGLEGDSVRIAWQPIPDGLKVWVEVDLMGLYEFRLTKTIEWVFANPRRLDDHAHLVAVKAQRMMAEGMPTLVKSLNQHLDRIETDGDLTGRSLQLAARRRAAVARFCDRPPVSMKGSD